ncbi:Putative periplasmic protein [hydrothermal vent metagenome]|uniref:Putative periplasmic protein n=1 Tax=hydrothermal vent metagenome TaxID=652676 RepID=A0A1W1CJQ6_9ZZZZ
MKKLLFLILPAVIFAQSFMISNITLPRTYIQNLDPYECDDACMQDYLDKGMIFSFLAHADKKLTNKELDDARVMNIAILNIGAFNTGGKLKIALLIPYKKIGKYASSTINATFAYLMTKSNPFTLKSYRIESENMQDLNNALQKIQDDGFAYVIAPLTKNGAQNIINLDPNLNIYFPTINKNDINTTSAYYIFGGIDYKAQSKMLLKEAVSPLIIFSDKSQTGKKLATYQEKEFLHPTKSIEEQVEAEGIFGSFFNSSAATDETADQETTNNTDENTTEKKVIKYFISRRTTNLEHYLKENENILNGSFFLNTPIIKTGMIMSQLTLYDTNATNILSTQINYDPLLLSMTQYIDRKDMIVANSIIKNNRVLIETNSLLGNDIVYDWINYTTTIGIDYFYNKITGEERDYDIKLIDNQMIYDIELLRPGRTKFLPFISSSKE